MQFETSDEAQLFYSYARVSLNWVKIEPAFVCSLCPLAEAPDKRLERDDLLYLALVSDEKARR